MGRLRCGLWCLVGVVAACPVHGRQIPKQPAPLLAVKMKELHEEITGCLVVTCYFVYTLLTSALVSCLVPGRKGSSLEPSHSSRFVWHQEAAKRPLDWVSSHRRAKVGHSLQPSFSYKSGILTGVEMNASFKINPQFLFSRERKEC